MNFLARLTISQRISAALGALLALLILTGLVAWINVGSVDRSAGTVERAAAIDARGGALAETLRDSIALSATYALTETDSDLDKVKKTEESLKERVEATRSAMSSPDDQARLKAMLDSYAAYDEATRATLAAIGERRAGSADFAKAAVAVKRASGGRTLAVHIQNPLMRLSEFDLVIPMRHDGIEGPNVMPIDLALHDVTPAVLDEAAGAWRQRFADLPRPLTGVLLGGSTRRHPFTADLARALAARLKALGGGLAIAYVALAWLFFGAVYRYAIRTGLIARYSAESVS